VRKILYVIGERRGLSGDSRHLRRSEGAKEDKAGWSGFLKHLKERGLKGVRPIISDACTGLAESAAEFFPEAAWQRCVVRYLNIELLKDQQMSGVATA
jgi:putative transposase